MIFLTPGEHVLSLTVTLGDFSEVYRDLSRVTDTMGSLYRKIVMITGETIDANRSYELFKQIPGFNDSLKGIKKDPASTADQEETSWFVRWFRSIRFSRDRTMTFTRPCPCPSR